MPIPCPNKRQSGGFTLIELMITLIVGGVLMAVAFPSFTGMLRMNRVTSTTNNLLTGINLARTEAIKSNRGGGICASTDGQACSTDSADWVSGWVVWADLNNNAALDITPEDERIRIEGAQRRLALTASAAAVRFNARGRPTTVLNLGVVPSGCPGGQGDARNVNLLASGMVRIAPAVCP